MEALKIPEYCDELSDWKKATLLEYAQQAQSHALDSVTAMARANPSQPFEFWQERNVNYQQAGAVIRILEADKKKSEKFPGLHSNFNPVQLETIFKKLAAEGIVSDKENFLGIFNGKQKKLVFWDCTLRGTQSGLFYLMKKISGTEFSASDLKKYFVSDKDIHDNWNVHAGTKNIIAVILKGI